MEPWVLVLEFGNLSYQRALLWIHRTTKTQVKAWKPLIMVSRVIEYGSSVWELQTPDRISLYRSLVPRPTLNSLRTRWMNIMVIESSILEMSISTPCCLSLSDKKYLAMLCYVFYAKVTTCYPTALKSYYRKYDNMQDTLCDTCGYVLHLKWICNWQAG